MFTRDDELEGNFILKSCIDVVHIRQGSKTEYSLNYFSIETDSDQCLAFKVIS